MKPVWGPEDLTREDAPFESQIRSKLGEDTVNLRGCVCVRTCVRACISVCMEKPLQAHGTSLHGSRTQPDVLRGLRASEGIKFRNRGDVKGHGGL